MSYLPEWRKALSQFPVIPWNAFIEHVRVNVNPLAADDHMKEVIQQLQLMGEVIYVKGNVCVDVIVLDPKWLCSSIGNVQEMSKNSRNFHFDEILFQIFEVILKLKLIFPYSRTPLITRFRWKIQTFWILHIRGVDEDHFLGCRRQYPSHPGVIRTLRQDGPR